MLSFSHSTLLSYTFAHLSYSILIQPLFRCANATFHFEWCLLYDAIGLFAPIEFWYGTSSTVWYTVTVAAPIIVHFPSTASNYSHSCYDHFIPVAVIFQLVYLVTPIETMHTRCESTELHGAAQRRRRKVHSCENLLFTEVSHIDRNCSDIGMGEFVDQPSPSLLLGFRTDVPDVDVDMILSKPYRPIHFIIEMHEAPERRKNEEWLHIGQFYSCDILGILGVNAKC